MKNFHYSIFDEFCLFTMNLFDVGFGVYVYGLVGSVAEGVELARKVLYSGEAVRTLDRWIAVTQKLMP